MSDPITIIILALQSLFTPAVIIEVPATDVAVPPAVVAVAVPETAPVEEVVPSVVADKLSCKLERKGDKFVAIVVADAAYSLDYDMLFQSKGSNTLKVKKGGTLELAPGNNRHEFNDTLKVGKQKITGELTLHGESGEVTCAAK